MSVSLSYATNLTAIETLDTNVPAAAEANRKVTHNQFNKTASLTGATTPPVTKVAAFEKALSAGAGTIDLTALPGTNGAVVDGTGLKVQAIKLTNKAVNANSIKVAVGGTNGYELAGADFAATLQPGQELVLFGNDATPDVDGTHKTLDLTGTGSQVLQVIVVLG